MALFKNNESLAIYCRQNGVAAEGLHRLHSKGGSWIIPGFNPVASDQRDSSEKLKELIRILREDVNGAKGKYINGTYSVVFDRVDVSTNMTACLYKMAATCVENAR